MNTLTGQTIKGYGIQDCIGKGAFGEVYRAYQAVVDREVAIKIILPQYANQPDFVRRFETEAQLIAHLEHLHIVPLYDYWRDPTGAYLVMRYLRGGNLRDWVREGPLSPGAALRVMEQVARALDLAHRHAIIHRDIKPTNILLDEERNAFLTDFGLAKVMGHASSREGLLGTPEYISPERIQGQDTGPPSDLYSLGLVLYEMLAGEPAFRPSNMAEMVDLHLHTPVPNLTARRDDLPDTVNAVIQTATAKAPAERYADALALARALREALAAAPAAQIAAVAPLVETLTEREAEVLRLMAEGLSYRDIAAQLVIAESTVAWYRRQIFGKLGVSKRREAIVTAQRLGLLAGTQVLRKDIPLPDDLIGANPYKGLSAFQQADAADFFGREALVEHLISCMQAEDTLPRFLAVVGPSGSGKSSLVRAGMLPMLDKGAIPGADRWFVVDMLPGHQPLDELEIALVQKAVRPVPDLGEQLRRDAQGLTRAARMALPEDGELLLVIDQFEELFTLAADPAITRHFLSLIHAAVSDPRSRVRVLITLRADFLDRPLIYPDFGELLRWRTELITPMTPEELEAAIVQPAENAGVVVQSSLVSALVAEVSEQPGTLPLLEYALTELFDRREGRTMTLAAYHELGGALGALARRADDRFEELSAVERDAARQVFLRLVTLGEGTEDVRRRVLRSELEAVDVERAVMEDVIDAFGEERLLTFDFDPATREPTVEVAHEALIQRWGRLRDWLDASRDDVRLQRMLASSAKDWREANQDTDFLLRGARLAQFEDWVDQTDIALTDDERVFLATSITEEVQRRARRRRVRYGVVATAIVVALIMAVLALAERNQAHEAQDARSTSDASAAEAQELALVNGAQAALNKGDVDTAIALAVAANQGANPSAQAQRILSEAAYAPGTTRVFYQQSPYAIAVSPDGRMVLSGSFTGEGDVPLILWDITTGQTIRTFSGHKDVIWDVAFSPDGRLALSTGAYQKTILWDVNTGEKIRDFEQPVGDCEPDYIWWLAFSPDGQKAYGSYHCAPVEWDVTTGHVTRMFTAVEGFLPVGLDITPDGRQMMTTSWDGTWVLWDIATGEPLHQFGWEGEAHTHWTNGCISRDGQFALTGSVEDSTLIQWDLETYQEVRRFEAGGDWLFMIACSPSGRLVLAGDQGPLHLWDLETGEEISLGETGSLRPSHIQVAFGRDDNTFLFGPLSGNQIRVWDLQQGMEMGRLEPELDLDTSLYAFTYTRPAIFWQDFSPDYRRALYCTSSQPSGDFELPSPGPCLLVDVLTGQEILRFRLPPEPPGVDSRSLFTPDGRAILSAFSSGQIVLFDAATGDILQTFTGHRNMLRGIAFSPDGRTFLSSGDDDLLIWWDLETGRILRRAVVPGVGSIVITLDSRYALLDSEQGWVLLWDVMAGQEVRRFVGRQENPSRDGWRLALSPDGRTFLSGDDFGGGDSLLILWDLATGQPIRQFSSPFGVYELQFSPDGQTFFSVSSGGLFQWDMATGEIIRQYAGNFGGLNLSPDGKSLYITQYGSPVGKSLYITQYGENQITAQWRIDSADELMVWTMNHRYVRELTCGERDLYQLEPRCDAAGGFPTSTPYPTPQPTIPSTPIPPTTASSGTAINLPQTTPQPVLEAHAGEQRGQVIVGDSQLWSYAGQAGETLTVRVQADQPCNETAPEAITTGNPCLDTWLTVTDPDGIVLTIQYMNGMVGQSGDIEPGINTDSLVEGLALSKNGTYQIEVSGALYRTGGAYTLTIESLPLDKTEPTPGS